MANWYDSLKDYDVNEYIPVYNTRRLVDGDMTDNYWNPWASQLPGFDKSRYQPTTGHGAFGKYGPHYTYAESVEKQPYYQEFGNDLIQDGKFTPMGEAWAQAVDALLPPNSPAKFYDNNKKPKSSWTTTYKDAHGRAPRTFTNLKDYVEHVRGDKILGARHNVFLKQGKRYFYKDSNGQKHWVNPEQIGGYTVSENPVEQNWSDDKTTLWQDYELTGLKSNPVTTTSSSTIQVPEETTPDASKSTDTTNLLEARHNEDSPKTNWFSKFLNKTNQALPEIISLGRYAANVANNNRVYNEEILGIRPNLKQSYHTYRQVVGDEAGKQNYYRRASQIQTRAGQPVTADASLQNAIMFEGNRQANELRAQGDLVDNQEIRRTSDESSQHGYANKGRDTEVANYNTETINNANAAIHNLLAQKYSANQTSLDNLLKGIQKKITQQREDDELIRKQIQALDEQELIANDTAYQEALRRYRKASQNPNSPEFQDARDALIRENIRIQRQRYENMLHNRFPYAKSGTKITYKRKDDLFYKSISDAVKHFREMSKLSLKALDKKRTKIDKLMPHPKKMQQGGVAPFTIYEPLVLGGERSTQVSTASDSRESKSNSQLDLIKSLFQNIEGLPIDISIIGQSMMAALDEANLLGLSSSDLSTIYLQQMQRISNLKFSYENYKQAQQLATQNKALNEIAVDPNSGGFILQDRKTGQIKSGGIEDLKNSEQYTPLTNYQLLMLRAYSPNLVGRTGDEMMQVVANGVGMEKIGSVIHSMLSTLGSDESTIEGYTKAQSNDIKQGIQSLLEAPDGVYKQTVTNKNSLRQQEMALHYIINMLPQNMRSVLAGRAALQNENPIDILRSLIGATSSSNTKIEYDAITGKGSSNSKSGSGGTSDNNSAALAFVLGQGPRELINFNTGTSNQIQVLGIKGALQTHSGENLGQGSTLQDATKSTLGTSINWDKATFGGSRLNPLASSHVILNDSTIIGMDLPYTKDYLSGNEVPDFQLAKKMEEADQYIYENEITDPNKINEVYRSKGLPDKFDSDGKLNTLSYKRFAAIQVTLDEQSLKDKSAILSDEVQRANDVERDLYIQTMRNQSHGDKKYDLSDGFPGLGLGRDELYKGTIFVPYSEDIAFAGISAGKPFDQNLPNSVAAIQEMQYAPKASQYKAPEQTLSQIKNN